MVANKFDFNGFFGDSIAVVQKGQFPHNAKLRRNLRKQATAYFQDQNNDKVFSYLKKSFVNKVRTETKSFASPLTKNLEFKFTMFDQVMSDMIMNEIESKYPRLSSTDKQILHRCNIYKNLNRADEPTEMYKLQDLRLLNFGDFISDLIINNPKPLVVYKGFLDILYVNLEALRIFLQRLTRSFSLILQRTAKIVSRDLRY